MATNRAIVEQLNLPKVLRELRSRIRALESISPAKKLITTDADEFDPTTVDPTRELLIGAGLKLTNPSAGVAELASLGGVPFVAARTAVGTANGFGGEAPVWDDESTEVWTGGVISYGFSGEEVTVGPGSYLVLLGSESGGGLITSPFGGPEITVVQLQQTYYGAITMYGVTGLAIYNGAIAFIPLPDGGKFATECPFPGVISSSEFGTFGANLLVLKIG